MATPVKPKKVNTAGYSPESLKIEQIFRKAEQDIIRELQYKRSRGLVDYSQEAALERVQRILRDALNEAGDYVPAAVERQYYLGKLGDYRNIEGLSTAEQIAKHTSGYSAASAMAISERALIDKLSANLLGTLTEAVNTTNSNIHKTWAQSVTLGRRSDDLFRTSIGEAVATSEASGLGLSKAKAIFLEDMEKQGVTAFTDKSGRNWSLSNYANMATRTTSRQSTNLGALFAFPEHDLYKISSHASTCPICAPFEGRVYSRSGENPNYPPLSSAFGKVDAAGPNSLDNSYLNIHPNCKHTLIPYTEDYRSEKEIEETRKFSSFEDNPPDVDPRSEAQRKAYREKEAARTKMLNDFEQFKRYQTVLGDKAPKTFQTFQKHKLAGSDKYTELQRLYRQQNKAITAAAKG
ncbi:MAG: phage minor capsid protein [Oscillospiraceae bacterium]|jgi:hypothetical protein|nr:phage minor capsid protein [Oscillospiraceae bacterium]